MRTRAEMKAGKTPGPGGSLGKLHGAKIARMSRDLAMNLGGPAGGAWIDGDEITDIGFIGQGCAISQASCSTMTEALKGKTLAEAEALFEKFHTMVTSDDGSGDDLDALGKLAVFAGVREFPMRVKCATLGWHTLNQALRNDEGEATTE